MLGRIAGLVLLLVGVVVNTAVPRPIIKSDRYGSRGQNGSHSSSSADQAGVVKNSVTVFCQWRPVADTSRPNAIIALPKSLAPGSLS